MADHACLVEVSARHVHLCKAHVEALFGPGAQLTRERGLSQPEQYLSKERVDIVGPKTTFRNVAVLGPARPASQVEVALTDCYALGVIAPVRESGDIAGTPGITLAGPCGRVTLPEGLIVARRHIHLTPADAARMGVRDKDTVSVALDTARPLIFGGVVARVDGGFALAVHIDTDEANAALVPREGAAARVLAAPAGSCP